MTHPTRTEANAIVRSPAELWGRTQTRLFSGFLPPAVPWVQRGRRLRRRVLKKDGMSPSCRNGVPGAHIPGCSGCRRRGGWQKLDRPSLWLPEIPSTFQGPKSAHGAARRGSAESILVPCDWGRGSEGQVPDSLAYEGYHLHHHGPHHAVS